MEPPQGLYWINTKEVDGTDLINVDDKSNNSVSSYIDTSLINTVDDTGSGYNRFYHLKAKLVHKIRHII